jgi:hypothetical protein
MMQAAFFIGIPVVLQRRTDARAKRINISVTRIFPL